MKTKVYSLILAAIFLASSCAKTKQEEVKEAVESTVETTMKLSNILTQYVKLKNSLVSSDMEGAQEAAKGLENVLKNENKNPEITDLANIIANSGNLETQRQSFVDDLRGWAVGHDGVVLRSDNAGASWISLSKEIENPYFGDYMLECGTVQSVF